MTSRQEPTRRDVRAWRRPAAIAAGAVIVLTVAWGFANHYNPGSSPEVSPAAYGTVSSDVILVAGRSTRVGANTSNRQVTISFDIDNIGHVPVDIAKVDVASRPGMQLLSTAPTKATAVPAGKALTVVLTYKVTNCAEAMSATATGPVPVVVNIATGTVTRMIDPTTDKPNRHWELYAAEQICNGPTLTES